MSFPPDSLHALLQQYNIGIVENHLDGVTLDDLHEAYFRAEGWEHFLSIKAKKCPHLTVVAGMVGMPRVYNALAEWGEQACFETEFREGQNIISWQNPAHVALFGPKVGTRARALGKQAVVDMTTFLMQPGDNTPRSFSFTQVQKTADGVEKNVQCTILVQGARGFARILSPVQPDQDVLDTLVGTPPSLPSIPEEATAAAAGSLMSLSHNGSAQAASGSSSDEAVVDPYTDVKRAMDATGTRQMLVDMSCALNHRLVHLTPAALASISTRTGEEMLTHLQVGDYVRTHLVEMLPLMQQGVQLFYQSGEQRREHADAVAQKVVLERVPGHPTLVLFTLAYHPRVASFEETLRDRLTADSSPEFRAYVFLDGSSASGVFIGFNQHAAPQHAPPGGEDFGQWLESAPQRERWQALLLKARCGIEQYDTMGIKDTPFHVRRVPGPVYGYYEVSSGMTPLQKYSTIVDHMTVSARLVDLTRGNAVLGQTVHWNALCREMLVQTTGNNDLTYDILDQSLFSHQTPMGCARAELFQAFDAVRLLPRRTSMVRVVSRADGSYLRATMRRVSPEHCIVSLDVVEADVKFMGVSGKKPPYRFQCRAKDAVRTSQAPTYKSPQIYATKLAAAQARNAFVQQEGWSSARPKQDPTFMVGDDGFEEGSTSNVC